MIPLSADEIDAFTPPSLNNVVPTPVFRFRAPTLRDQKRYNHLLSLEGLRLFDQDAIRGEIRSTLKANWSPETYETEVVRLDNMWAKLDQEIALDGAEESALIDITMRCMDVSPSLRRMDADNKRFMDEAPGLAMGMFLVGWQNLETPFAIDGGRVPFEKIDAMQRELVRIETKASKDKVEGVIPGFAFMQLSSHAFQLLSLKADEAKNSDAPSLSSETQNGTSTKTPRDGASPTPTRAATTSRRKKTQPEASPATI